MRYVSLFSGIEAASVAWRPLGWKAMCFSEIDPFCSAVLKERFPEVLNFGDVKEVDWVGFAKACGRPDVVVGGSPCQSFSVAGKREGLEGESGLMWEYVRAVRELMPDWVLWENVPGALSSSHGEDFRCLLESLDALGYGLAWRVLDAQFFGVPQRRERVFLVGCIGDVERACEVLFEPESLRWDPPSSKDARKALASSSGRGAECAGFSYKASPSAGNIGYEVEQAPTLLSARADAAVVCVQGDIARGARMGQNGKGYSEDGSCYTLNTIDVPAVAFEADQAGEPATRGAGALVARRLTATECERLQGFPDGWTKIPYRGKAADECPDSLRYKALGNSMAVPVMKWIGRRIEAAS